ncbi:T9SS type A sorting domain-containing protein [Ferruginibacter lapsinanis]|uniref:T9SS type A sorting domain-containing protein n=1 Tax=Ferruginibacter lapsinanis TaxID=563172 RepID=UPI001E2E7721|nr:T9SS type A sorting domain-containing protein [Ferruginibacter lapsinanis]UEG48566.1 T9SS type A sorting domain-containing protein [Ferruginibacter lapsinanis]
MKNKILILVCSCLFVTNADLRAQIDITGQAKSTDNTNPIPADQGYFVPTINSGSIVIERLPKSGAPDSIEPVSLLSLVAVVTGSQKVDIYWSSSSETNIAYYIIERSKDDVEYKQLIKSPAVGNSRTTKNYYAFDASPSPNYTFYRLKQIDLNGQIKDGPIVRIKINTKMKPSVYPNPFSEFIMMDIHEISLAGLHYTLSDMNGRKHQQDQVRDKVSYIQVRELPQGAYVLSLCRNDIEIQSFTVIKK